MVDEVEVTAEGTPLGDLSPHGQLIAAFEALKAEKDAVEKEKTALSALTALQKKEKEDLVEELDATKKSLAEETSKNDELEAKMELRAASAECQIAEVESFSKDALAEAIEKNARYSEKISDLQTSLKEEKDEKEHLLKRTALLARRDQLQKANIEALTNEIDTLTDKIIEFENQFSLLATRSADLSKIEARQGSPSSQDSSRVEKLLEEKRDMTERLTVLEDTCERMKKTENIMKETFVETLSKHRDSWMKEKGHLKRQVKDLISEKESIEAQVKEIAELLERDALQRHGRIDTTEETEQAEVTLREPPGIKKIQCYNQ